MQEQVDNIEQPRSSWQQATTEFLKFLLPKLDSFKVEDYIIIISGHNKNLGIWYQLFLEKLFKFHAKKLEFEGDDIISKNS